MQDTTDHGPRTTDEVDVNNLQSVCPIREGQLRQAAEAVLRGEAAPPTSLSLAIVDDAAIHQLNRRHLQHDYATDVLSFRLEQTDEHLDGEVIVSAETAARQAEHYGWSAGEELALYVIHGTLHVLGYDDATDEQRHQMRELETKYLGQLGIWRREKPDEPRR